MATPAEVPMPTAGLSSLDADFLDGMIALQGQLADLCTKYIGQSDHTSSPMVVDMARGALESAGYTNQMLREARGYADGDQLRRQEAETEVEVEASY